MQNQKKHKLEHELSIKRRKKRTRQLIIIGSLFEKAGVLDNFKLDNDLDKTFILGFLHSAPEFYDNDALRSKFQQIGKDLIKESGDTDL